MDGSTAQGSSQESSVLKNKYIPKFDNITTNYKEWRKRMILYDRRMDMQNRSKETGLNVLSTLTGASWRQCEDLDLANLEKETGLQTILERLDKQW